MSFKKKQWTLESAQRDYRKQKKICENCQFANQTLYSSYIYCNVKRYHYDLFTKIRAKMCKYYTPKEVR